MLSAFPKSSNILIMSPGKCSFAAVSGANWSRLWRASSCSKNDSCNSFSGGVQPIEMRFLLSEIPPLIFSPLVQGVGTFPVESHINHPKFVKGFQHSLYRIQF